MTREEAVEVLKERYLTCVGIGLDNQANRVNEAIDMAIKALQTGAEPIVIRSKTLMPTKDFEEWAKRVREVNPNAIVIPCDAEVVSADAVQGEWIVVTNGRGGHECSNCHAYAPSYMSGAEHLSDYCPNCGARMKPYKGGDDE